MTGQVFSRRYSTRFFLLAMCCISGLILAGCGGAGGGGGGGSARGASVSGSQAGNAGEVLPIAQAAPPSIATPTRNNAYFCAAVTPFSRLQETNVLALESGIGRTLACNIHYFFWAAPGSGAATPGPEASPGAPTPGPGTNQGYLTAAQLASDKSVQDDILHHRMMVWSWRCGDNLTNIANGRDDASVIIPAARAAVSVGQPLIIRFFYEMNLRRTYSTTIADGDYPGCFTPGETPIQQAAEYRAAEDHIIGVFRQQGANNVAFSVCFAGDASNLRGDEANFVDTSTNSFWGFDLYDRNSQGFVKTAEPIYYTAGQGPDGLGVSGLGALSIPGAIFEAGENGATASGPGTQQQFLSDVGKNIAGLGFFPNVLLFSYFDAVGTSSWPLTTGGLGGFKELGTLQTMQAHS